MGEYQEAEALFWEALALWRGFGSPRSQIWCITYCSPTLLTLGKHREAQLLLRESLALSHATEDHYGVAMSLHHLGLRGLRATRGRGGDLLPPRGTAAAGKHGRLGVPPGPQRPGRGPARGRLAGRVVAALAAALASQAIPEALHALVGLAEHLAATRDHAAALELCARALADPVCGPRTRRQAEVLRTTALAWLSPEEAAHIQERAAAQPLREIARSVHDRS